MLPDGGPSLLGKGLCAVSSDVPEGSAGTIREMFRGARDVCFLFATTSRRQRVLGFAARQDAVVALTPGARDRWRELQRHIDAAYALRHELESSEAMVDEIERGLSASCLGVAPGLIDDVRGRLRRVVSERGSHASCASSATRPSEAAFWEGVLSGRLAIVDRFDARGLRHIVALPVSRERGALKGLSAREREVLELLGEGLSNKAIGFDLGVSTSAVSSHVHHIFGKIGVRDRTELVRLVRVLRPRAR